MPIYASTMPVLGWCWQHRPSTGLVRAHNGMFTRIASTKQPHFCTPLAKSNCTFSNCNLRHFKFINFYEKNKGFIYRYVALYMSNFTLMRWLFSCQCIFKVEYLWSFLIIPQIQYASLLNDWLYTSAATITEFRNRLTVDSNRIRNRLTLTHLKIWQFHIPQISLTEIWS